MHEREPLLWAIKASAIQATSQKCEERDRVSSRCFQPVMLNDNGLAYFQWYRPGSARCHWNATLGMMREVRRTSVEDEHEAWHPGSRTPTQTHAQTTAVCVAGDGAGAHQTSREQGRGGRGCEYRNEFNRPQRMWSVQRSTTPMSSVCRHTGEF